MNLMEHVAHEIRALRTSFGDRGISQEELARELGTTANTISRWETGTYKPTIEDLDRISRFFGVSILRFFPDHDELEASGEVRALLRAAKQLKPRDLDELRRYAEFRKARSLYGARKHAGRKRRDRS